MSKVITSDMFVNCSSRVCIQTPRTMIIVSDSLITVLLLDITSVYLQLFLSGICAFLAVIRVCA